MDISNIEKMKGGWFIGNFEPSVFKTELFEVGTKLHKKGEKWPVHFHKKATEITYVVKGKMKIQNKIVSSGDIFLIKPYEVADPEFLEDTYVLVVKTPSCLEDKYCIS